MVSAHQVLSVHTVLYTFSNNNNKLFYSDGNNNVARDNVYVAGIQKTVCGIW